MKASHSPDSDPQRRGQGQHHEGFEKLSIPVGRVHGDTLRELTKDLALMVDSGLPLLRTLRCLERAYQEKDPILASVVANVGTNIERGATFSEALAQHPKLFNRLYTNMVRAGELGGVLEVVLNRLEKLEQAYPGAKTKDTDQSEQFAWVLGTLVGSGVPILQSLTLVKEVSSPKFGKAVAAIHESVKEGETITAPMEKSKLFDPILVALVDVGEQTGALPELLIRYAEKKAVH